MSKLNTGAEGGNVPLPDDDMSEVKQTGKRVSDGGSPSPTRQRADAQVAVDVETLRGLLAEQSAALLAQVMKGQREQLATVTIELRQEMKDGHASLKAEMQQDVREQSEAIRSLQTDQKHILLRLQKLENGTSSGTSTIEPVNLERHRFTLVFGGWSKDTARQTITTQLHQALQDLNLAQLTDFPGFTTGPRRSIALMQFRVRSPHEDFQSMRERMQQIVGKISRSAITVKGGSKLWCGFSKSKADRDRGSHAALVRRTVRALDSLREPDLEVEYGSGSTWLGDFKFSSASLTPDGIERSRLLEFDPLCPGGVHPWIKPVHNLLGSDALWGGLGP